MGLTSVPARRSVVVAGALGLLLAAWTVASAGQDAEAALVARARAIHDRVLTLDTHDDINPTNFTPACNYTMPLATQVTLPKMVAGGLDVAFLIVYVGQGPLTPDGYAGAYAQAVAKFDAIHALTNEIAPGQIGLALTPTDVRRIAASGRKVAVIGVENAYPIGTDLARVREFHERGARYMSLAHNGHNQLADSNTGEADNEWQHGGLSPLGREAIAAMNRLGIMVDISHPSKASALQAIALSRAPVIASHSAVRSLADHSRNLDDETLAAVKANGGVVQVVALSAFLRTDPPGVADARTAALAALRERFGLEAPVGRGRGGRGGGGAAGPAPCALEGAGNRGGGRRGGAPAPVALGPERQTAYDLALARLDARYPPAPRATVGDLVDHIDYVVKRLGIDHVGISSDFDGGGGIDGWNSAAETFNVTLELVRRGYTEDEIGKIWSGNLLRVWEDVERVARDLEAGR